MKTTLSSIIIFLSSLTTHAADVYPSAPRTAFCSVQKTDGTSFASRPANGLIVDDTESDNVIRKSISTKVIEQYVSPAMKASCASPGEGFKFINDASTACLTGCTETIGDWNLRGQPRADMLEICRADCRGIRLMLMGVLVGSVGKK